MKGRQLTGEPATGKPSNAADPEPRVTHVVAGAVTDFAGRILIAQRPPGKQLAGRWEFPGGKLEPGETRVQALVRELKEELGIAIGLPRPLIRVRHAYPFGDVLIDTWVVRRYSGEPEGLDGQALRWCSLDELATADLLPADRPIVRALSLPENLTDETSVLVEICDPRLGTRAAQHDAAGGSAKLRGVLCSTLEEGVAEFAQGADFLVLRCALIDRQLQLLTGAVTVPVYAHGVQLESAWRCGATGVSSLTS